MFRLMQLIDGKVSFDEGGFMAIPKIIHYCWFGKKEKPKSVVKCIESWKKYCPDYEIREWNENNLDINTNLYSKQAYEAKAWGFVPDYFRLWIIYVYGGIYLDTDVQIVRSFDSLLDTNGFCGFEDNEHISLGLGFGAEAGNKLIAELMQVYNKLLFFNEDGSLNRIPSPVYSTMIMKEKGLKENNGTIQYIDGFACYPPEYFCPKSFQTGILKLTKNSFSIHQFDASWYTEEEQKMKKKYWRAEKIDYWRHFPNRLIRKIFGDKNIDKLKEFLGK